MRSSEEILEFDRLRELLRGQTTSPLGHRAVNGLAFRNAREELDREFKAIAEAISYLRAGSEMGFGDLADPEPWFVRLAGPSAVLTARELLDVASLADTSAWLRELFVDGDTKTPLLAERARSLADLRPVAVAS